MTITSIPVQPRCYIVNQKIQCLHFSLFTYYFCGGGGQIRTDEPFRTAAFQERFLVQPDYLQICAATVLISTLSECEPVIISLLVEFEPLTMGDKPVSNNTYETSMLNKIGIMEALYPDLVPPQGLLAALRFAFATTNKFYLQLVNGTLKGVFITFPC